jgi:hypothetical protein
MDATLQLNAAEPISRRLLSRIGVWIVFYVVYFLWLQVKRKEFAQELPVKHKILRIYSTTKYMKNQFIRSRKSQQKLS